MTDEILSIDFETRSGTDITLGLPRYIGDPERWELIPGFDGWYSVSSLGRIRRNAVQIHLPTRWGGTTVRRLSEKVLCLGDNGHGYKFIPLRKDKMSVNKYVHRLVAECFLPGPRKATVNHIDGDKTNNRVENLEWATQSENNLHAVGQSKLGAIRVVGTSLVSGEKVRFASASQATLKVRGTRASPTLILRCVHGKAKTAYGYRWERA